MKTFALIGNPNSGKTTLFNALTGATAHVGNWPGVTVDKREGTYKFQDKKINIVDLPGIYSLSPYTPEEVISRNFILDDRPDGIINIVDSTNLERNLYLTTQLLEMDIPIIVVLNMIDEVEKSGDRIDIEELEKELGVPVVAISALKKRGVKVLMERAAALNTQRKGNCVLKRALEKQIDVINEFYNAQDISSPLFHSLKLLEGDEIELNRKGAREVLFKATQGVDFESTIADERYKYICEKLKTIRVRSRASNAITKSYKIDRVLTHRVFSIPIFIVIMFLIFHFTFSENLFFLNGFNENMHWMPTLIDLNWASEVEGEIVYNNFGVEFLSVLYDGTIYSIGVMLTNLLNLLLGKVSQIVIILMQNLGAAEWTIGLVSDGILGGIFSVLGFLPQILLLFLFFSILEDTGYMARIAFVLDKVFRKFGLSGRAFLPMIMGFGCSLPAMANTRTLADDRERTATIRVIPFFSCGAKLPILTACGGALCTMLNFGNADIITFSMYLLGICTAIICVLIMRNTTQKGEIPPFIMELPLYRMPSFLSLTLHLWDKAKHFIQKAFTLIFASTVIIWLLSHLSWSWEYVSEEKANLSILASIGMLLQPLFTPLGFGSQLGKFGWVFAVAALTGLLAKEDVIATFGTLASCIIALGGHVSGDVSTTIEGAAEVAAMVSATGISGSGLIAFIAFNMTTIPCFAACATARGELQKGKFKNTLIFWFASSYLVGSIIYSVGSVWWSLFIWLAAGIVAAIAIVLYNKGFLNVKKLFKR